MSNVVHDYIENYIRSLIVEPNKKLTELEEYAKENNIPIIQKETSRLLEVLISIIKPKKILELGTAIGYSSIVMYLSSNEDTIIKTVEKNEEMILKAKENIKNLNLENNIKVISGDVLEVLKDMNEEFDIIFLDAGKGHYNHLLPYCLNNLSSDGVIIADNVLYKGMVASREMLKRRKITIVKRMKKYLELINEDESLITSVIPIGDGLSITKRRN